MFAKQKNGISLLTGWIGGLGLLLTILLSLYWVFHFIQSIDPNPDTLRKVLALIFLTLCSTPLIISTPLLVSLFFLKMFPSILVNIDGIEYQDRFGLTKGTIKWGELRKIIQYDRNLILLVVEKEKRKTILDGLYFNRLYALLLGRKDPVILISTGLENHKEILEIIVKNSPTQKIIENRPGW